MIVGFLSDGDPAHVGFVIGLLSEVVLCLSLGHHLLDLLDAHLLDGLDLLLEVALQGSLDGLYFFEDLVESDLVDACAILHILVNCLVVDFAHLGQLLVQSVQVDPGIGDLGFLVLVILAWRSILVFVLVEEQNTLRSHSSLPLYCGEGSSEVIQLRELLRTLIAGESQPVFPAGRSGSVVLLQVEPGQGQVVSPLWGK